MTSYKNENALLEDEVAGRVLDPDLLPRIKINGGMYQESGIPDILCCIDGLFIGIEFKHQKPGETREHVLERTTLKQRQHIARIVKANGMAGVALTPDTALEIVKLAKLKAKMLARGDDPKNFPLPPDWDALMTVPASRVVNTDEVQINPTPLKEIQNE